MFQNQQDAFANLVAHRLVSSGETPTYDKEQFALLIRDSLGNVNMRINLSTYYHQYQNSQSNAERNNVVASIATAHQRSFECVSPSFQAASNRIYPYLKDLWTIHEMRLSFQQGQWGSQAESVTFPCATVADVFAIVLALDKPDTREIINSTQLDDWNADFQPLFYESCQRLSSRTDYQFMTLEFNDSNTTFHESIWEDGYDAVRVLFGDKLTGLPVNGKHIFVTPNSDKLIVTGSEDLLGLTMAAGKLEIAQDEPKPLPPIPLTLDEEGCLVQAVFPPGSPIASVFARLRLQYFNRIYAQQQSLLQQSYEALVEDRFMSTFLASQDQQGNYWSTGTITEGVACWLPKTDRIMFTRVRNEKAELVAQGTWDTVSKICPELLEPIELYPPRFEVNSFPTNFQIARINQAYS